jgi:hypothetical protein
VNFISFVFMEGYLRERMHIALFSACWAKYIFFSGSYIMAFRIPLAGGRATHSTKWLLCQMGNTVIFEGLASGIRGLAAVESRDVSTSKFCRTSY